MEKRVYPTSRVHCPDTSHVHYTDTSHVHRTDTSHMCHTDTSHVHCTDTSHVHCIADSNLENQAHVLFLYIKYNALILVYRKITIDLLSAIFVKVSYYQACQ